MKVLIIADDYTGALDTGVKFAKVGMNTVVVQDSNLDKFSLESNHEVVVVCSETRHCSSIDAYHKIAAIFDVFKAIEIPYIFKKTDSALRGNCGKELEAVLSHCDGCTLHFVPAYPQMNRIVVNGELLIDGVPVHNTMYGEDPFTPVSDSSVFGILAKKTKIELFLGTLSENGPKDGIVIYDSQSKEDLSKILDTIDQEGGQKLFAGCGGFAEVLAEKLSNNSQKTITDISAKKMVALCGSVNDTTVRQTLYAQEHGIQCVFLKDDKFFKKDYFSKHAGEEFLQTCSQTVKENDCTIITTGKTSADVLAEKEPFDGKTIAQTLCMILYASVKDEKDVLLLLTGGDVLIAFLEYIHCIQVVPLGEIQNGIVLSEIEFNGHTFKIISKSGGFGSESLIVDLARKIKEVAYEYN